MHTDWNIGRRWLLGKCVLFRAIEQIANNQNGGAKRIFFFAELRIARRKNSALSHNKKEGKEAVRTTFYTYGLTRVVL